VIDNWRWAGVPFYLRTGKRLADRHTEISVHFKPAPFTLFRETSVKCTNPNVLRLLIQPEEGISLSFDAKQPGPLEQLETVTMDFSYAEHFHREPSTGYETLLFDAMAGDQTLFHRMDIVEAGWQIVQPILDSWSRDVTSPLPVYKPGSWGPAEADSLLARDSACRADIRRGVSTNCSLILPARGARGTTGHRFTSAGVTSARCRPTTSRATSAWRTARSWLTYRFHRTRSIVSVAS
jgi:glucose-6-phosphate 1-dehydrogenase